MSSVALGGRVISVSDEFFAEAYHLLKVEPAQSLKGQFGPNGALYSGWETKRHNPTFDWCIIKLGAPGYVYGFDIDTSHFNGKLNSTHFDMIGADTSVGNEAPAVSVEACYTASGASPNATDPTWEEILPKQPLGPNSRHLFQLSSSERSGKKCNHVKLNMFPDGGIARFRVYGIVEPDFVTNPDEIIDLAHAFSGGRAILVSDQHFGKGSNLLLPGRGKDMGDGWETKRSREMDHKDWVIIRLGQPGILDRIEIDTNHFKGNCPESCEIHACFSPNQDIPSVPEERWIKVLSRIQLKPHIQQYFNIEEISKNTIFTHVRITIYPDGGIKRVRIMGRRIGMEEQRITDLEDVKGLKDLVCVSPIPMAREAFSPYGQVIMSWETRETAPLDVKVTTANQGTALKFHNLAMIESSYPIEKGAKTGFSVYRSSSGAKFGDVWKVKILERHPCTNQAFIPMCLSMHNQSTEPRAYLVIVALNNKDDDKPDLKTLRAFVVPTCQGVVYNTGIWHHPILTIGSDIDFFCVETQIGNGDELDCNVVSIPFLRHTPSMIDSRKRPLEESGDTNVSKRRALSSGSNSPVVNGKTELAPEDINAANLEVDFLAEHERAQERITELEKRRDFLQANFTAIVACWEQLVREISLVVKPEDLPSAGEDLQLFEIISKPKFGESPTFLNELLRNHGIAAEQLVSGVLSLNPRIDKDRLLNRCTELEQEVINLRAEIFVANAKIFEIDNEKERYYSRLLKIEARLDRMEISPAIPPIHTTSFPIGAVENNTEKIKKEELHTSDTSFIQPMKSEEIPTNGQLATPSHETLKKSSLFEQITNHLQTAKGDIETYREKCSDLGSQVEHLREAQEDFKEKITADYNVRYEEQKNLIIKKELENSRLREQRDGLQAEVNEIKTRASERKSASQFEVLLQARADRIAALECEVKRLKSQLAANAGNESLLELILGDQLTDLPDTLRSTQERLTALESTLSALDVEHPEIARHIRSEGETKQALAAALARLERYESLFGSTSAIPPAQKTLIDELSQKDELLRKVELQLRQEKAASNELFSEIERLSAAWEALDRQNKSKIFDMDGVEVKLQKLTAEKAKADNKYFAAMRQKEAAEAERKAAARALEKLQKTVDRFTDAEKSVSTKLVHQEKEISIYQKRAESSNDKFTALERQHNALLRQDEDHGKSISEVRLSSIRYSTSSILSFDGFQLKRLLADAHTREKQYKQNNQHLEEECMKLRKQVDRLEMKAIPAPVGSSSSREAELEERVEKCMHFAKSTYLTFESG
ncbi:hypothetical protein Clacol_000511 [Clathrus columnatus]|uniref:Allantoicase n=1 Tax=Clathrus columnatus TaxID=1419009 RepID=A0AAV4ZZZ4_9AGAM|nr:hypothetical protein Clacol_000511 [Clathrus columnatus]